MSNKVDNVTLNFTLNARAVEQAGSALQKELEKGLGRVDFNTLRRSADKTFKQMGKDLRNALSVDLQVDTSKAQRAMDQVYAKRSSLEAGLAKEALKGVEQTGKRQGYFARVRENFLKKTRANERKIIEMQEKGYRTILKIAEKTSKVMNKIKPPSIGGGGGGMMAQFGGGKGGKGGGGGGAKAGAKAMGGFAKAMGPVVTALGMVATGVATAAAALLSAAVIIGASVGAFTALIAIVVGADSKMKELNKTMLSVTGGADMMGKGFTDATASINNMRDAAIKVQHRHRSLAKDNIEVLKTLHEHGATVREISKDMTSAQSAVGAYGKAMGLVLSTSRMIGESASTVAQNMATQSEELGLTLGQVAGKFQTIGRYAMDSGFSTKRFFSMVIQATSGMSMYNVRLEEASGLLVRIGKILGQKTGGEFLSSLTKGFVNESMTDRIKRIKLAGTGRTQKNVQQSAESTADAFIQDIRGNAKLKGMQIDGKSVADMGNKELVNLLKKMDPAKRDKMIAKFHIEATKNDAAAADGIRNRLVVLANISEASNGGLLNMAKNLDQLDMGGKLNMMRDSMKEMFPGKEIHELSTKQLAALEGATGMQGEQLRQMKNLTQGFDSNFAALQELSKDTKRYEGKTADEIKAMKAAQVKATGAFVDETGRIIAGTVDSMGNVEESTMMTTDADGKQVEVVREIKDLRQYYDAQGKRVDASMQAANFNEDHAISQEIADNTWSISDALSAGITQILNGIYKLVQTIVRKLLGGKDNEDEAREAQGKYQKMAISERKKSRGLEREAKKKDREAAKEKDAGKREELEKEARQLRFQAEGHAVRAVGAQYTADNVYDDSGNVNTKLTDKVRASDGRWFGLGEHEVIGSNSTNKVGLNPALYAQAQGDEEFMEQIRAAAPTRAAYHESMASGEGQGINAEQLQKAKDAEYRAVRRVVQSAKPSSSLIADTTKLDGTIGIGDKTIYTDGTKNNPMGGDQSYGQFLSDSNQHSPLNATPQQQAQAYGNDSANRQAVSGMGGFVNYGMVDYTTGVASSSLNELTPNEFYSRDYASPSDSPEGRHDGNLVEYQTDGHGPMKADIRAAETLVTNRRFGDDLNRNKDIGGTTNHDGMQYQSVSIGQEVTALKPNAAAYHQARSNITGGGEAGTEEVDNRLRSARNRLEAAGVDWSSSQDQVKFESTTDAGVADWDANQGIAEGSNYQPHQGDTDTQTEAIISDTTHTPSGADLGQTGLDTMGLVIELEKLIGAGVLKNEDGSDYTLADLDKDLKAAMDENGKTSAKAIEDQIAADKAGPWKTLEKHREESTKIARFALKQNELLKTVRDNTSTDREKENARHQAAENLAGYAGFGADSSMANRLKKGELPAQGTGAYTKLLSMKDDQGVKDALMALGIEHGSLQDFIYQGGPNGGIIRPIHGQDSFLAMGKPGGPMETAMGRGGGGGGTIIVNVYSDVDVEKVKRAVYQAGRSLGIAGRSKTRAGNGNFGKTV